MQDAIYGLTMQDCAEIMSKDGELKAQYGERGYGPHFQQYLASRGTDENTWAHAWNGWWTRMEADPSGQLHAQFAMMQQQLTMRAHMADVPDASGQAKEGVTLETYAKIMAGIQGGGQAEALIAQEGIAPDQWQRAQAAWNQAMAEDVNHHLTTQYGQLYAKHSPGFQEQMQAQMAAMMAARSPNSDQDDEPQKEYTFEDALAELSSPKPNTRWTAAHHCVNFYDMGDLEENPGLKRALAAVAVAIECLEQHDEYTVSNAESLARDLSTLASAGALSREQADDAKGAMSRCLNRAREKLQTLEAAFAPIRDKAVPERVHMQSAIQDYTSLVEDLTDRLNDWDESLNFDDGSSASASSSSSAMVAHGGGSVTQRESSGGFLAFLKSLPIIGAILRALGF